MDSKKIIEEFQRIKKLGYVASKRSNNTGIGKTFEDYLGVAENNLKEADFEGFEVKSKRALSSSFLTLFTKSPNHPKGANTMLRDLYGENYEEYPGLKRIHTSIFSNKFNTYRGKYGFKIVNDKENQVIRIVIKDLSNDKILSEEIHWTYMEMANTLENKIQALFYVNADCKMEGEIEHFHYTSAVIYVNPTLEKFLKLIDDGKMMVDIRIGSYKSGKNLGKTHDHGTGFRIKPVDLCNLFSEQIVVE